LSAVPQLLGCDIVGLRLCQSDLDALLEIAEHGAAIGNDVEGLEFGTYPARSVVQWTFPSHHRSLLERPLPFLFSYFR